MTLIDSHSHILKKSYGNNLDNVIKTINEKNVIVYNIAYDLASSKEALNLNKLYKNLIPVIGIHPNDSLYLKKNWINELEILINKNNVAAIGEIGLDYHYPEHNKENQIKIFIKQIELANKCNLPIVVHTRDSLEDCFEIVKNYPNQKFLFHSWSGDDVLTKKYLLASNNFYFSFNGILTFNNAKLQQEVIKLIPIDKLLFETDCPFLSPSPFRGEINYPWKVKDVINYAAKILNYSFEELNFINNKNVKNFYLI